MNTIDGCDHCGGVAVRGCVLWPRFFRKDLLLCFLCWQAFYERNHIEKAVRKGCAKL